MKTAIVYYSLEGNTHHAALLMAETLGADLIRLSPVKEYPTGKASKYFWAGKSAVFGEAVTLEPYVFDPGRYDLVILGTPIWAGTFAPPLRTFIRENSLAGKKAAFFACCSGGSAEKCFDQLKKEIGERAPAATLRLVDPLKADRASLAAEIAAFCAKL